VIRILIISTLLVVLPSGCDRSHQNQVKPVSGPIRTGTAIIRGTVTLSGKPPQMQMIPNQPCHAGAKPFKEETVVVDATGHLANVVVHLEDAPPAPVAHDLPAVVLDQIDCRYVPHVLALRTGQTLHVASSDPTLHNVHGQCTTNDPFNFALVAAGQFKDLTFGEPEAFPIRCDVHPWMKAYVHVFTHPYFAVTASDGTFEIKNVPAGTYTLVASHEKYGTMRTPVVVSDETVTIASFTFASGL
jgi:plastocyanin